jgi:hypothetical protein
MQMMLEVRNKAINAYKELSKIQMWCLKQIKILFK